MKFDGKYKHFYSKQILEKLSAKWGPFRSDSNVLRKPWEDFIIGYVNVDLFDKIWDNMAYIDSIPPFNSYNVSHCNLVKVV